MNIFTNFISHKVPKFDYKIPECIISLKYAEIYYGQPSENNMEDLINQANKCTQPIPEAKKQNIAKMIAKLDDLKTAPKTYWFIQSRFSK